jgi:hypothetical protein
VLISQDVGIINTCLAFGLVPSGGIFGHLADAFCDLARWHGMGPIIKWVDDFVFARIRCVHRAEYNERRAELRRYLEKRTQDGIVTPIDCRGCCFFEGPVHADGTAEQYVEDFRFPVRDLSTRSAARTPEDAVFCYDMQDIDDFSAELGVPWSHEKTLAFAPKNQYHGMVWNIPKRTVGLEEETRIRYLESLQEWQRSNTHVLAEAERLAGRLQFVCYIIPMGRPYIASLYRFVGLYGIKTSTGKPQHAPEKPLTPERGQCPEEIRWWIATLSSPNIERPIPRPVKVIDIHAFSDASSTIGIGVVIGDLWAAFKLLPGWHGNTQYSRDIGWAEAVGFELACRYVFDILRLGTHVRFWCDNAGVVEGWWKGRSRNIAVNDVFKRLMRFLDQRSVTAHTRYIESARNPADGPSRFDFSKLEANHQLPRIPIPSDIQPFVVDHRDAPTPAQTPRTEARTKPASLSREERQRRARATSVMYKFNADYTSNPALWWDCDPNLDL